VRPVYYERRIKPNYGISGKTFFYIFLLVLLGFLLHEASLRGKHLMGVWRAQRLTEAAKTLVQSGKTDEALTNLRNALSLDPRNVETNRIAAKLLDGQGDPRSLDYYRFVVLADAVLPGELADFGDSGNAMAAFFDGDGNWVANGDRFHGTSQGVQLTPHATQSDAEALVLAGVNYGNPRVAREVAVSVGKTWNRPEFPHLINAALLRKIGDVRGEEDELRLAVSSRETSESLAALADFLLRQKQTENKIPRNAEVCMLLERIAATDKGPEGIKALGKILTFGLAPADRVPGLVAQYRALAKGDQQALLFADEIELARFPASREQILANAEARAANLPFSARISTARWLLDQNDPARAARILPINQAAGDKETFETGIETLFALKQWDAAEAALRSPKNPLAEYETAALSALGKSLSGGRVASAEWSAVFEKHRKNPPVGLFLLEKCAIARQWDVFFERLPGMLNEPLWAEKTLASSLQSAREFGDSETLLKIHAAALNTRLLGGNANVRSAAAFDQLMAGMDVPDDRLPKRSESHIQTPSIRITRALWLLTGGSPRRALFELEDAEPAIEPPLLAPQEQAAFAAVLAANGRREEAIEIAKAIPRKKLTPQEQAFLDKALAD
jgi:Tfp pilus assembly protein PilF